MLAIRVPRRDHEERRETKDRPQVTTPHPKSLAGQGAALKVREMSLSTAEADREQTPTGRAIMDLRGRGVTDRVAVPRNVWRDALALAEVPGLGGKRGRVAQALAQLLESTGAPGRAITHGELARRTPSSPSERTVRRAVEALEDAGWLYVVHRRGGGGVCGRGNLYRLTLPATHPWAAEWQTNPQADRLDRARKARGWRHQSRTRKAAARRHWRQSDTPVPSTPNDLEGERSSPARPPTREESDQQPTDQTGGEVDAPHPNPTGDDEDAPTAAGSETSDAQRAAEGVDEDLEEVIQGVPERQRAACRHSAPLLTEIRRAVDAGWTPAEVRRQALEEPRWPSVVTSPAGLVRYRVELLCQQQQPPTRRPRPPVVGGPDDPLTRPPPEPPTDEEHQDADEPCGRCTGTGWVLPEAATAAQGCPDCCPEVPDSGADAQISDEPESDVRLDHVQELRDELERRGVLRQFTVRAE